ncbi:MAG: hypothetical protein AB9915_02550 [Candidatus Dojkabacteria bacterium]
MKIIILLLVIANMFIAPMLGSKETYPIDTSEDILIEGISDPGYIAKDTTQILP